VYMIRMAGSV